jgi:hypothetical protein
LLLDFAKNTSTHGLYDEPIQKYASKTNRNAPRLNDNISGIDLLVPEKKSIVELPSRHKIEMMIEEIKTRKRTGSIKDLAELFESSYDIGELCDLIVKIDTLYNNRENGLGLADWIAEKWRVKLAQYPDKRNRFIKAFKTRAKAIVKSARTNAPKKVASLYYFIDFLIEDTFNKDGRWF